MAINYIRPDTGEKVQREPWAWIAHYNDGTTLEQFEVTQAGATFHSSTEIDSDRCVKLQLLNPLYPAITVIVPPSAVPVHFYRNSHLNEYFKDEKGEEKVRTWDVRHYVIGFKQDGKYWLVFTDEQNSTVFTNDDKLYLEQ